MSNVLLVSGMSGAGRSTVSAALEDGGWSVIDNLPLELIPRVTELATNGSTETQGLAFILGRGGAVDAHEIVAIRELLRERGFVTRVLFLDAPDEVLIRRFEGNRRRHPFTAHSVAAAITAERSHLAALAESADVVIDTGALNTNQLRRRIADTFRTTSGVELRVNLVSFGFANGIPRDADIVLDCRFLPNPHWEDTLREFTGLSQDVSNYVLGHDDAEHFVSDVVSMLAWQTPAFSREGKSYLTVAVGCTGGKHRSVAVVEEIGRRLAGDCVIFHRDVDRS
jgi:UPF0042 nucleotide-binding protein